MKYELILRAFQNQCWAILPEKLQAILSFLQFQSLGGKYTPEEIQAKTANKRTPLDPVEGKIQILNLFGTVIHRADEMDEISGAMSTETFGKKFDAAIKDPNIGAIVIEVDSPGGSVYGVEELSTKIYNARGQKPIISVANALMASAAYWIGSSTDTIVATPSADVGSIGVYAVHFDLSQALSKEGVKPTIIRAGKFKAEGIAYEPLSDVALTNFQQRTDAIYDKFLGAVSRNRGASLESVRTKYGEGRLFSAEQALQVGMIDRIATMEQVLSELTSKQSTKGKSSSSKSLAKYRFEFGG